MYAGGGKEEGAVALLCISEIESCIALSPLKKVRVRWSITQPDMSYALISKIAVGSNVYFVYILLINSLYRVNYHKLSKKLERLLPPLLTWNLLKYFQSFHILYLFFNSLLLVSNNVLFSSTYVNWAKTKIVWPTYV